MLSTAHLKPSYSPKTAPWPFSCSDLFLDKSMKVMVWMIGVSGLILNTASLVLASYDVRHSKYQKHSSSEVKQCYSLTVASISVTDLLYCLCLWVLAIADTVYGESYALSEISWRKSMFVQYNAKNKHIQPDGHST